MKKASFIRTALCAVCVLLLALLCSSCNFAAQTAVPYETEPPAEATVLEVFSVLDSETTEPGPETKTTEQTSETTTEETTEEAMELTTEEKTDEPTEAVVERSAPMQEGDVQDYVVNTNTGKFHYPTCSSAGDIKPKNRSDRTCTRDELIAESYVPCKRCNP